MIIRARAVVTMDGPPIANGAVAISGNKIAEVGDWPAIKKRHSGEVVELGERVLLPGLINAHCHLDYTALRGKIARQNSFADWIRAINAAKAKLSADDYVRSMEEGFAEALRFGTTSIVNLTAFPELIARLPELTRAFWFAELIDIRAPAELPKAGVNLAPHAPFTASAKLFRECEAAAEAGDLLLTTHLAESAEEMQMSRERRGALADLMRSVAPDLYEGEGVTPIEYLAGICRLDQRWLLAHVNEIAETDFALLAGKPHVAHCPRSHLYFGHTPFKFAKLREHGLNICLGTDSLASNDDLSLFAEMRQFSKTGGSVSALELIEMVTINPARALRREGSLGRLCAGYFADAIAIPCGAGELNLFDEIVAFSEPVPWVMIDGKTVRNA